MHNSYIFTILHLPSGSRLKRALLTENIKKPSNYCELIDYVDQSILKRMVILLENRIGIEIVNDKFS